MISKSCLSAPNMNTARRTNPPKQTFGLWTLMVTLLEYRAATRQADGTGTAGAKVTVQLDGGAFKLATYSTDPVSFVLKDSGQQFQPLTNRLTHTLIAICSGSCPACLCRRCSCRSRIPPFSCCSFTGCVKLVGCT